MTGSPQSLSRWRCRPVLRGRGETQPFAPGTEVEAGAYVAADALDGFNNDAGESWCGATNPYAPGYFGTPGGPSDCPVGG